MALGELERYREILLTSSEGIWSHHTSTSGKRAAYGPGYQPLQIRAFAAQNYTTFAYTTAPVVTFWLNSSPGLTATGNYTSIDTITVATGGAGDTGQTYFATPGLTEVLPGQEVVAEITTPTASTTVASEAHRLRLLMFVEPSYRNPGENSNMTASA